MRLMICSLALALAVPTLAQAGPAGSGLAHTEAVHAKRTADGKAEPLRVKAPTACLAQAEAALAADPAVRSVARWGETFVVHPQNASATSPAALQRIVDGACGQNASAS